MNSRAVGVGVVVVVVVVAVDFGVASYFDEVRFVSGVVPSLDTVAAEAAKFCSTTKQQIANVEGSAVLPKIINHRAPISNPTNMPSARLHKASKSCWVSEMWLMLLGFVVVPIEDNIRSSMESSSSASCRFAGLDIKK